MPMENPTPAFGWWRRVSRRVRRVFRDPDSFDRIVRHEVLLGILAASEADRSRAILDALERLAQTTIATDRIQSSLKDQLAQLRDDAQTTQATVQGQWEKTEAALRTESERVRSEVSSQIQVLQDGLSQMEERNRGTAEHVGVLHRDLAIQAESTRTEMSSLTHGTTEYLRNLITLSENARTEMFAQAEFHRTALAGYFRDPVSGWELSPWKMREIEGLIRASRRRQYVDDIRAGRLAVPKLDTDYPLALESNDTKHPRGSKNDNSIALRFNRKLYQLLEDRPSLRFLDLGCAGGGLVRSMIDDGHFAVGLDGSDYPLVNQTGEWGTISRHLFTCDVTRPFFLSDAGTGEPLEFDAITGWELMEHILDTDIPGLMANVDRHLAPRGYVLFSVATFLDHDPETGVVWHVTIKPRTWWLERFRSLGFVEVPSGPLGKYDWLRGSGLCRYDWTEDDGMGFHVALRRISEAGVAAADAA